MKAAPSAPDGLVRELQRSFAGGLAYAGFLSLCVNILLLTVPLFMLQVQERVIVSRSFDTLTMLLVIAVGALFLYGAIEFIRSLTFQAMASIFARRLNLPALEAAVSTSLEQGSAQATQAIRDLNDIRYFIASSSIATPLEAAWSPIFLAVLFAFHPIYGLVGVISLIILLTLGVLADVLTRRVMKEANEAGVDSVNDVGASLRHAETIEAMGMLPALAKRWRGKQVAMIELLDLGTRRAKFIAALTRSSRMTMQLAIYATGATLIIKNEVTVGTLMAASILLGRLLAPFDSMINDWRAWVLAAAAWKRVRELLLTRTSQRQTIPTPVTTGDLVIDRVVYAPPGAEQTVIKSVSFSLSPGEVLGIVGPSGAGKSTLARLLVGVLKPNVGGVYLDGHNVFLWERGSFGDMVGYLPQSVSLLNGTIAENIARMRVPDPASILEASRTAGVHELIGRLPLGYDTSVADGDFRLSGGQRQRIGLARALYGSPRLLVLDEPNANLDAEGEQSLIRAINAARETGAMVVLIAHRPSVMQIVDKIMILREGRIAQFGPRSSIAGMITPGGLVEIEPANKPSKPLEARPREVTA
ncbi:type I secretion system permease/ATPase [Bosea caraganae]|uniref:Type I secretion system permease/ATPase n=1 Tax=Bosea caraganae TaxID=2763117 RepID=A0A370L217_9HYPH|nr:type I secretion system permease/ATPase [Bosea caraganae]RDJ22145.1 type I secretion system permease/ATPase [Bosea caraganae]RDJ22768.1 type I secretion system permease/ATPase [Bosea caraganae]